MNFTLFKSTIKANKTLWLIIVAIFVFYISMMISMFDPESTEAFEEMIKMLPKQLANAMGFSQLSSDLTTFISNYIYGFLVFLFPMIFTIIVNNRLIASHVDRGSMAYLLSTPNSRKKIVATQALFSIFSITLLLVVTTIIAIIIAVALHPGHMNIGKFLVLNVYTIIFYLALSGISFFASCVFNDTTHSLAFGSGIPIGFFVIQMLGNASPNISWFQYFTLISLYSPKRLMTGQYDFFFITSAILIGIAIGLYSGAIYIFNKRDLPL